MKCLKKLSILQLVKLSQRFGLNPQYKNPRKRKAALIRCLREYWKINPIGECSICWEQIQPKKLCVTPCAHLFCAECLIPYVRQSEKCPLCRAECPYVYLINRMIRIPEIVSFLKTIINISRREQEEEHEQEEELGEEEEEDTRSVIYHINIYIIIQRNFEHLNSFVTMFAAVFFAYYYYLLFLKQGIWIVYLFINVFSIFCFIYYMLTTSVNNTLLSY